MITNPSDVIFHIGLPKAASTYLQSIFARHNSIEFINFKIFDALREVAYFDDYSIDNKHRITSTLSEKLQASHKKLVFASDERLSSWRFWDSRVTSLEQLAKYQQTCCSLLCESAQNAKVLLITRSPQSWVISLYKQYVKSGESRTLAEYCHLHYEYIVQSYNIDYLLNIYRKAFGHGSLWVAPVESLWEHPDQFIASMCNFINTDTVYKLPHNKIYRSLSDDITEAIRSLNSIIDSLSNLNNDEECRKLTATLKNNLFRFIDTTMVDNKNATDLVQHKIGGLKIIDNKVPSKLLSTLRQQITSVIDINEFKPYIDNYFAN